MRGHIPNPPEIVAVLTANRAAVQVRHTAPRAVAAGHIVQAAAVTAEVAVLQVVEAVNPREGEVPVTVAGDNSDHWFSEWITLISKVLKAALKNHYEIR
jgi:hypothetical protein